MYEEKEYSDLVNTECLQVFQVEESYCDVCGDITPHHFEDLEVSGGERDISEEDITVSPMSSKECVICRENEEMDLS